MCGRGNGEQGRLRTTQKRLKRGASPEMGAIKIENDVHERSPRLPPGVREQVTTLASITALCQAASLSRPRRSARTRGHAEVGRPATQGRSTPSDGLVRHFSVTQKAAGAARRQKRDRRAQSGKELHRSERVAGERRATRRVGQGHLAHSARKIVSRGSEAMQCTAVPKREASRPTALRRGVVNRFSPSTGGWCGEMQQALGVGLEESSSNDEPSRDGDPARA